MQYGSALKDFLLRYRQTGKKPKALADMPRLLPEDRVYSEAFHCLSAARTYNMGGPNPIQLSEMVAYLRDLTFFETMESRKLFVRFMQLMDNVLLTHAAEKAEAKRKAARKPNAKN